MTLSLAKMREGDTIEVPSLSMLPTADLRAFLNDAESIGVIINVADLGASTQSLAGRRLIAQAASRLHRSRQARVMNPSVELGGYHHCSCGSKVGRPRKLSMEQETELVRRFLDGASYHELTEIFKISSTTVAATLRRYQWTVPA